MSRLHITVKLGPSDKLFFPFKSSMHCDQRLFTADICMKCLIYGLNPDRVLICLGLHIDVSPLGRLHIYFIWHYMLIKVGLIPAQRVVALHLQSSSNEYTISVKELLQHRGYNK